MGRPGTRLGADLTLVEPLGKGGRGEAWLVRDRARGMVVAKVLGPAAGEERRALLEREWNLARRLEHPAIVRVLGFGREGDLAWLTQEHVPGGDARRLRGGAPADVVRAILPVIDALEHAHALGVVHRDIKASNVLLDGEGRGRLADFGLAAAVPAGPAAAADEPPHPADDVYGLGTLLYDLLLAAPVPKRLAELVSAMLAKRREERPGLADVRNVLRESLTELARPPRSRPDIALHPPPRPGSVIVPPARAARYAVAPTVALFGVLAVAAVGVFAFLPRWMASRPRPAAVESARIEPAPSTEPPASPRATSDTPEASIPRPPGPRGSRPATATARPEAPPLAEPPGETDWTRAMSEGLAALDRGEFAEARAAFTRAEAARPGTSSAADGLARAEEGQKAESLSLHRTRGESAEGREDWRGALVEYDAALKLEPRVAFALEGRARSVPRAELDELLAAYLKRPGRLSTEAVAREADLALDRARDATPAGPRLQEQIAFLERLLREARTPVEVHLLSDGLTEVVVLRVGALGTFHEKALALRPGSYVVLGKRRGYRDARKTLLVPPAQSPPPLVVRCDEAL